MVVGPDGQPMGYLPAPADPDEPRETSVADLVEQPAKVMRIGSMIKQLLEEVRTAPLDEESRTRLRDIHRRSIAELEDGLAPELVEELERLSLPFTDMTVESLGRLLPDRTAPILIYCNNNFANAPAPFPTKLPTASLNLSTYIALWTYGYRNIYELGPLVDLAASKLAFESSAATAAGAP